MYKNKELENKQNQENININVGDGEDNCEKENKECLSDVKTLLESIGEDTSKFIKDWGERKDWKKFLSFSFYMTKILPKYDTSELSKLRFYEKLKLDDYGENVIRVLRLVNGAVWVSAGVKAINNDDLMGRWELIISPPIEIFLSNIECNIRWRKEKREKFIKDSRHLLDAYHALNQSSSVNKSLEEYKGISELVKDFLDDYNIKKDGKIDELEWVIARKKFADNFKNECQESCDFNSKKWKQIKKIDENLRTEIQIFPK